MYLKSIEISGFKSFAKKADLKFDTSISAIVGPNGSGKSNVAEAFRFVLGEQSIKSMRGKRGEDLIFNGTNLSSRLNRASVKITFDNVNKFLDIDYDEVIIERIVNRDGTNQYFINKSLVRLKDITELLAGANIGSSGHHIISQGEADRILNVNPQERRVMIEEALGLKIYQYKRIVSEKKLKKVSENIESVQSLRRENVPHLRFLKKQVEKIKKSLDMREELKGLYQEYFKREDLYIKYWGDKITEDKKPLVNELSELEDWLNKARTLLESAKKPDEKSQEIISLEKQLREIREIKDQLTFKLGRTEGTISALKIIQPKPKKEVTEQSFSFSEVKDFELEINSQIKTAEELEDINQVKSILKRIKESFSQFIQTHSQGQPQEVFNKDSNKAKLEELEKEIKDIQKKIDETKKQEGEILLKYQNLKQSIEQRKDSSRDAELAVFEITAQQSEIRSKLNSLKNQEEKVDTANKEYKRELNEAYILAGRDSIQFQQIELKDKNGEIFSQVDILEEDRDIQSNRRRKIERIKIRIEDLGGGSGEEIIKEYEEAEGRDVFLLGEIEDLEKSAKALNILITELKEKIDIEFKEGLLKIDIQFKDFFVLMFGGGKASLKLVKEKKKAKNKEDDLSLSDEDLVAEVEESEEEENEGIEVDVSLPNKKIKGLQMLSGGERSLTSIALLFAMSQVTPPPFIILDETDAALDEANSKKYGDMIETLSKSSQLILITHNRETMARADTLYGVTMGSDGTSRLLSVHFDEAVKVAK
ncbi:MAG: AAA family ATPase [Patescibacteria group bacterium]|nr:AAA family ATPase [Patescibacteria group bacterium]